MTQSSVSAPRVSPWGPLYGYRSTVMVIKLAPEQIPAAASLLARAFAQDPVLGHYLHPGWRQRTAFEAFFQSALWDGVHGRQTYAAIENGSLSGVALWFPPEGTSVPGPKPMRSRIALLIVQLLYPNASRLLLEGFHALEAHHPPQPHWYLAFIGVEPSKQGRRIGPQLLGPVLDEADRHAQICYLETPFPATHKFYLSLGFHQDKVLDCFRGAPDVTSFVRPSSDPGS
jgi:GNAT superfamily N-acetyltransferase